MKEKNTMYYKPIYKCGICDKEHSTIAERSQCEQACLKKQEEEAKKAAERKKAAEYEVRKKEVDMAFDHAYELKAKFLNDYDSYTYSKSVSNFRNAIETFGWLL